MGALLLAWLARISGGPPLASHAQFDVGDRYVRRWTGDRCDWLSWSYCDVLCCQRSAILAVESRGPKSLPGNFRCSCGTRAVSSSSYRILVRTRGYAAVRTPALL